MKLSEARCVFSLCLADLVIAAHVMGYDVAFDEVTDHLTAKDPTGDHKANSNHYIGLAGDLILYKDGIYLTKTEEYEPLGLAWENMGKLKSLPLVWGGRFSNEDGNHFSYQWGLYS
jgi:hypothetical protein